MKKIVFDLTKTQSSSDGKFHGGGKYGIVVFKKLVELAHESIIAYYNKENYINDEVLDLIEKRHIPYYFQKEIGIVEVAKKEKAVIYSPLFDKIYLKDSSIKVLVTIHGIRDLVIPSDKYKYCYEQDNGLRKKIHNMLASNLGVLRNKHLVLKARNKYNAILNSPNVTYVTVSNHSKYAIMCFFPFVKSENLKVFYSPSTIFCREEDKIASKYGKYWLLVSGNRWIKNSIRAIIAFDELFTERLEIEGDVVITGLKSLDELKVNVANRSRFKCVNYVDEDELRGLYKHAYAFVYPTLFEGFGYPPLEAMHEGCPVISSAIASVPEVCGNAVLYFNPYSIAELKMRILQIEEEKFRKDYAERGIRKQREVEIMQDRDLMDFCNYIIAFAQQ